MRHVQAEAIDINLHLSISKLWLFFAVEKCVYYGNKNIKK